MNNAKFCEKFCLAVVNDSRSYSAELLPKAVEVLWKTKGTEVDTIERLVEVDAEIKKLAEKVKREEIDVNDVPDEFLDPILSMLMDDPVKLPSGYVVDRTTISRHLLSDQTDPFTRLPLTMQQCEEDKELKARIDQFKQEYFTKKNETSSKADSEAEMKEETTS